MKNGPSRHLLLGAVAIVPWALSCALNQPEQDPCLSQCELRAGSCEERDMEDFATFDQTSEQWVEEDCLHTVIAGSCADGKTFLYRSHGSATYTEVHYFDAQTGEFLGLETSTDGHVGTCGFYGYWPHPFTCDDPVVMEVLCGPAQEPGDPIVSDLLAHD